MIFVINLDTSKDRLAAFAATNQHLTFERFAAVDGHALDLGDLQHRGLIEPGAETVFSRSDLGCAMSHRALWEIAAGRTAPTTIFEDDAIAHQQFETLADRVITTLPSGWTIVMWGWNFDGAIMFDFLPGVSHCRAIFDQAGLRRGLKNYQALPIAPVAYRLGGCFGTVGYTVSPSGAETLAATIFPIRRSTVLCPQADRPFQVFALDIAFHAVFALRNAYVSIPPLVVTSNYHEASTIQARL